MIKYSNNITSKQIYLIKLLARKNKYFVRNIVHLDRTKAEEILSYLINKKEKPSYFSEYLFERKTSKKCNNFKESVCN
jgi:hypothetical protein